MIIINYDSTGKPQTIHIQIDDYWAHIPWNPTTQSIDWDSIDYQPTRDSIQSNWNAWVEGKDLAVELAARPDLAPTPVKQPPDWIAFNEKFLVDSGYLQVINASNPILVSRLETLAISANTQLNVIQLTWNSIVNALTTKPTSAQIANWNGYATDTNMLFSFDSNGLIVLS
jgi:hypothetical protein